MQISPKATTALFRLEKEVFISVPENNHYQETIPELKNFHKSVYFKNYKEKNVPKIKGNKHIPMQCKGFLFCTTLVHVLKTGTKSINKLHT